MTFLAGFHTRLAQRLDTSIPGLFVWLLSLMLMAPAPAYSQAQYSEQVVVPVVGSGNGALDEHLLRLIRGRLQGPITLERLSPDSWPAQDEPPGDNSELIITIGPSAFSRAWQANPKANILALLVDKSFIDEYVERAPGQIGAVYYDVPLVRQALTGKAILPQARKIALLATTQTATLYDTLLDELPDYGMEARVFIADTEDQLIPTLNRALGYGDFLLAARDDRIYNARNIKPILLTAYRRNTILIGPSQGYVKAGALASGYTPFVVLAEQATAHIQYFWAEGEFASSEYPDTFSVEVNEQVARSLNIPLPDRDWISNRVDELLKENREASE
ncbi:hypothetical protein SAMN05216429_109113 [Marinobacter persicus]|uniref:ABC transporter substrate binding protein n=2 Tax=Marinobacter persicus TaxID=930118 RepID=A0A1I3WBW2_9GAMM|nr:hypothetical protein SAMN05216429_109113 [Marinobacter persicus]